MKAAQGSLVTYANRLNETPWLTVLGYAWAYFMTLSILLSMTPAHWRGPLKTLSLALPLMLFVAKDLAQLPDVLARLRALRGQGAGPLAWLAACLPPGLVGLMRIERAMWHGFLAWLRRQPKPARPAGTPLGYDKQGAYSTVIAIALFSVFVELPLNAAILPLLLRDPELVRIIHVVCVLGSLYTLAWLFSDRWQVAGGHHVLTDTCLDLRIGARASARIPLDAIEDAQALRMPPDAWRKAHAVRAPQAVNITPFDKPNLVLRLRAGADAAIVHHGVKRSEVRYVFLYLDRPDELLAGLARPQA